MTTLLIVYHSQSGASAALARAVCRGARAETGVKVGLMRAWDASTEDMARANGLILVAAENSAALCGGMKDFLDRTFYPAIELGLVLPYALVLSAGNDGRAAAQQAQRILSGYPFPAAIEPLILRGKPGRPQLQQSEDLGRAFAAGISMGIF